MKDTKSIEGLKDALAELYPLRHMDDANVKIAWGEALLEYLEAGHQLLDLPWFQDYPTDFQQLMAQELKRQGLKS